MAGLCMSRISTAWYCLKYWMAWSVVPAIDGGACLTISVVTVSCPAWSKSVIYCSNGGCRSYLVLLVLLLLMKAMVSRCFPLHGNGCRGKTKRSCIVFGHWVVSLPPSLDTMRRNESLVLVSMQLPFVLTRSPSQFKSIRSGPMWCWCLTRKNMS